MTTETESHWKVSLVRALNLLGVLASLVLIGSISFQAFTGTPFSVDNIYNKIQLGVCIYFLLDFSLQLFIAHRRWRFFARNFILILLSIPYSYLLQYFYFDFSTEVLYVIHFLPII